MYTIGKKSAMYDGKTKGQNFLFTLKVVSTFADTFTIQLFNVIKSVIFDGTTQNGNTYVPFTINSVENIVAGANNVGLLTDGSLNYKNYSAATNVLIQTPSDQNLKYRDIFNMLSAGQYLKMSQITIISSSKTQLTQGTMNVINISDLGVITRKSVPLLTFYTPNQEQNGIIDMYINTELCKNQGLEFNILPGTTTTLQFYLEC
jgi:hypothetical protein